MKKPFEVLAYIDDIIEVAPYIILASNEMEAKLKVTLLLPNHMQKRIEEVIFCIRPFITINNNVTINCTTGSTTTYGNYPHTLTTTNNGN